MKDSPCNPNLEVLRKPDLRVPLQPFAASPLFALVGMALEVEPVVKKDQASILQTVGKEVKHWDRRFVEIAVNPSNGNLGQSTQRRVILGKCIREPSLDHMQFGRLSNMTLYLTQELVEPAFPTPFTNSPSVAGRP